MPFTQKDSQTTDNGLDRVGTAGRTKESTSFTPASSYVITRVSVKIAKENGPVGNAHLALYADDGGGLPGALLATSTTSIDASTLSTTPAYVDFDFVGQAAVLGTKIHIASYGDGAGDGFGAGNLIWEKNDTVPGQKIGVLESGTWFELRNNQQHDFKTYESAASTSAAVTGTGGSGMSGAEVRAGAKTLIITMTGDTFVAAGASFDAARQAILDGIVAATSPTWGWNVVRASIPTSAVVRTSATVCTITLPALAGYQSNTTETLTITVPAAALVLAAPVVATPTVAIARTVTDLSPVGDYNMTGAATRIPG